MIRKLEERIIVDGKTYVDLACLHTDSKPTTGIVTGSHAVEVDTGDNYLFDEVSAQWNKIGAQGGSEPK